MQNPKNIICTKCKTSGKFTRIGCKQGGELLSCVTCKKKQQIGKGEEFKKDDKLDERSCPSKDGPCMFGTCQKCQIDSKNVTFDPKKSAFVLHA